MLSARVCDSCCCCFFSSSHIIVQGYHSFSSFYFPGDLIVLKQGDAIVADGVFISGSELQVDESPLTGETEAVNKDFEHPFLMSGTAVLDGEGVFLVVSVGIHSTRGMTPRPFLLSFFLICL